ncbi:MAG: hypothetical protein K0Q68_287 [Moraxellaceae bacterium]|jgi:hypothetical protein|nr:hypothetical protein [Moraxellaceae bacterium]
MISPETRLLLSDALTPPPGHVFDCGVATTFSLDLVTLLAMPLHMAWLATGDDTPDNLDPVLALEGLRRVAERFTVFSERGRLQVPRAASPLLSLLETMVHEVVAPHGGAFHPKVWLMRFKPEEGGDPPFLRLLVMSRNLTDDGSWDLSVCLEGPVGKKHRRQDKLAAFLKSVAGLKHKDMSKRRASDLDTLILDASAAEWELPGKFEQIEFHALGLGKQPAPWLPARLDRRWDELGVISPFIGEGALRQLAECSHTPLFLVSRAEELDRLPERAFGAFQQVLVMRDGADQLETGGTESDRLTGLHAKAYIGQAGWDTHLFVGSANATDAALMAGKNVEFMVELTGKRKAGLPSDWISSAGIGDILEPYQRSEVPAEDAATIRDQQLLDDARRSIAMQSLSLACDQTEDGWTLTLKGLSLPGPATLELAVWPLTVPATAATAVNRGATPPEPTMPRLSLRDVTSLVGFRLRLNEVELNFGLEIPLINPPAGRDADVMRGILENREGFLRYMLLLLGKQGPDLEKPDKQGKGKGGWNAEAGTNESLFEMLARAYARDPGKLDYIESVMVRLRQDKVAEGDIVPEEFEALWQVVASAGRESKE